MHFIAAQRRQKSFLSKVFGSYSNLWISAFMLFVLTWAVLVYAFASDNETVRRVGRAVQQLDEEQQPSTLYSTYSDQSTEKLSEKHEYDLESPMTDQNYEASTNAGFVSVAAEDSTPPLPEPSLEYELMRRRLESNIAELWNYFNSELGKIRKKAEPALAENSDQVLQLGAEHKRSLRSDMERLRQVDGYESWREQEARNLSDLVQRRLHHLQNPEDCENARKLVCIMNQGNCGYGCQLHNLVRCFIMAYATERTMVLNSYGWQYENVGWDQVFLPISETCDNADSIHANRWLAKFYMPLVLYPGNMPLAIPEDLTPRLKRLHGEPIVWWLGQFLKYLIRPQKDTGIMLELSKSQLNWQNPIVGVYISRTVQLNEAAVHSIEEYMLHVENYFLTLDINNTARVPRRIFLASDDARVIEEARRKFPHYEIMGAAEAARGAELPPRHTDNELNDIILDVQFLSLCDYLVCSFNSHMCRVAYEIMQTFQPDAANRIKSLDKVFLNGDLIGRNRQVVIAHVARNANELDLQLGDVLKAPGEIFEAGGGFSKGKNVRTNQVGLFPVFKVVNKVETAKLPQFDEISRNATFTLIPTTKMTRDDW